MPTETLYAVLNDTEIEFQYILEGPVFAGAPLCKSTRQKPLNGARFYSGSSLAAFATFA